MSNIRTRDFVSKIFTAIQHLTVSKTGGNDDITIDEIQQSLLFFPLVGFYIGLFLVLINITAGAFLPDQVVDILLVLFLLVFTKAKHLKGILSMTIGINNFSETKSVPSNDIFKLFLLLFFILMIKFLLLNNIVLGWENAVLLVMPVMGRWSLIFLPYLSLNRPKQNLKINPLYGKISIKEFWTGTIITSIIALLFLGINGIIIFMLVTFVVVFFERIYQKKINGVPENVSLGMVEITEIITLIFFIVLESSSRSFISDGILV